MARPAGQATWRTRESFGDVEVELEFLIPRGSNSGLKFEGLYEIQILDSSGVKQPKATDCGGIYPRANLLPNYHYLDEGHPPLVNACLPAGKWQRLEALFLAPRFDAGGKKTAPARLVQAVLNGQLIQRDQDLATPTGHAWRETEPASGPLLIQADHGPVAIRHFRIRRLGPEEADMLRARAQPKVEPPATEAPPT